MECYNYHLKKIKSITFNDIIDNDDDDVDDDDPLLMRGRERIIFF